MGAVISGGRAEGKITKPAYALALFNNNVHLANPLHPHTPNPHRRGFD
jgi:hypothetical protein